MTTNPFTEAGSIPQWTVGDRMRKARERTGMSQQEFADALGIARNSVVRAEKSDKAPRRPVLLSWAMATGTPVSWLETGENKQERPSPDGEGRPREVVRAKGFEPPTFCSVVQFPIREVDAA